MYETFDDQTYEIVGIYDLTSNPVGDYALAEIEVFIPYNAVKGSWDNHIVSFGPMNVGNTTFEIENGTIDEFLDKWNQQEFAEELEVTFYDKGYIEFEREIESRKMMSNIFLVSGLLHIFFGRTAADCNSRNWYWKCKWMAAHKTAF